MNIRKTSVFYHAFTLTLSNLFLNCIGFLYRIFLSRMIGNEGMGVYQLIMPYYSVILALCVTGLTMATSRLSAKQLALGNDCGARQVVYRAMCIFITMFSLVAALVIAFCDFIAADILGDVRTRASLLILLPCLFFTGIENILKNYFFGTQKLKAPITSELSEQVIRALAVGALLFIFVPQNPAISSALIICGMVASEIASVLILARFYGNAPRAKISVSSEILSIAAPISLSALLNNVISAANSVLLPRRLICAGFAKSTAISQFGILFGMTMPLLSLPFGLIGALTTVIIPTMSQKLTRGATHELRRKAGKLIHTTSLLAFPSLAVLVPLGRPLCQILYNNPDAGAHVLPLCIAVFFSYFHLSLSALLNAIGKQGLSALISVVGGVIHLIGTWFVGFPSVGIVGFLAGDILSAVFCAVCCFIPLISHLKLSLRIRNWFVTPAISALLSALLANFVYLITSGDGMSTAVSLVCALITATATYLISLKALGTSLITYLRKLRS